MQPADIETRIQQARLALMERRFDDARIVYQEIVEAHPEHIRAWLALSALAQNRLEFREAVSMARNAGRAFRDSGDDSAIAELCMRLLMLGEYRPARETILSADWNSAVVLKHSMGLVQYLGLTDAHAEALQLADLAASKLAKGSVPLIFARANALRHMGRMQEATIAYEQCLALDPLHAEAHWTLAHHQPSEVAGSRVSRIRKAIAHTDAQSEDAAYLQYALFKELDQAGETEDAWRALALGSRIKSRAVQLDPAIEDAKFAALAELFTPEFLRERADGNAEPHVPVFIVGLPRSGTTVLERMLANGAGVRSAGELNDFPQQLAWELNRFLGEIPGRQALRASRGIDYASLGEGYFARTIWRAGGATHLIDKLPNNLYLAGYIHKAIPNAKIVCLKRDPMDSAFSAYKHLFSGNAYPWSYDLAAAGAHYQRFARLVEHWTAVMPETFLSVGYESLVSNPQSVVQEVAAFCGIPYQSEMTELSRNPAPSATASSSQIRSPLHAGNLRNWVRYEHHLVPLSRSLGLSN